LFKAIGTDLYGVNFICTLLFLIGIFSYAQTTVRPWLAIGMVIPYLGFIIGMSGIRQAAAIGIGSFALARWTRLTAFSKLALIVFAAEFHTSALFLLIFILLEGSGRLWLKVLLLTGFVMLLSSVGAGQDAIEIYNARYVAKNIISHGSVAHIALSSVPGALYLIFRKRLEGAGLNDRLVAIGSIGSIVALPLSVASSTGVDRLALFFSFVQMWTYPALVASFPKSQQIAITLCVFVILFIFVIYFTFGVAVAAFVPYRTILFGD
jgi:hypothetical protein